MKKSLIERSIEEIMNYFDFREVHEAMKALDWTWVTCSGRTPDVKNLRVTARRLLTEVAYEKERVTYIGTGGFIARKNGDSLSLSFEITDWDNSLLLEKEK